MEKYNRLAKYSLDKENKDKYGAKYDAWSKIANISSPIQAITNPSEHSSKTLNKYIGASVVKSRDSDIMESRVKSVIAKARRISDMIERSRVINEAINAKIPVYADNLRSVYGKIKKKEGCMDICLHGAPYYTEYEGEYILDTETLAYIIRGRKEFKGNNIRLLSCSTGKSDKYGNCVAQELANILNVNVYAPIDDLNIYPDGSLTIGKQDLPENDGFKWFRPRR